MTIHAYGSGHGDVMEHQPTATLTQAAPVQNTWYTILDTIANGRLIGVYFKVADTGEDLQPELLNREDLEDIYRTELSDIISYEEMFQSNLIKRISQSLIYFANLAIKLNITPAELSSETSEDPHEDIQEDDTK